MVPGCDAPVHFLLHVPEERHTSLPAVLFLHGGVTYVYPESLWWDVRGLVKKNQVVRERFVVVAPFASVREPIAVISKTRTKANRFGVTVPYVDDFDVELTWQTFLLVCQSLGCDMSRLSVVGYSMGGQAAWDLMCRHGSHLAAGVPFAACCCWKGDSWKLQDVVLNLSRVTIRSYCGKADTTYSWRDFSWIAERRGRAPYPWQRNQDHADGVSTEVFEWDWRLQLCLVSGTASCHCCWDVVFHNEESFLLFTWLEQIHCETPLQVTPDEHSALQFWGDSLLRENIESVHVCPETKPTRYTSSARVGSVKAHWRSPGETRLHPVE